MGEGGEERGTEEKVDGVVGREDRHGADDLVLEHRSVCQGGR